MTEIKPVAVEQREMLPCPFCEGRPVLRRDDDPGYPFYLTFDHTPTCVLDAVPTDLFYSYATEAEAIAAWNTRASLQPTPSDAGLREALRNLRKHEGYGVHYDNSRFRRCAELHLYGPAAKAAYWLYTNTDKIDATLHSSPSLDGDQERGLEEAPFQARVKPWMDACFGSEISADKLERCDRFMEEALELVQASDYPKERAYALIEYVYGRDQGEINQEVGGVMVTLAAHCLAFGVDMHEAGETELTRIWTKVEQIRAKQAAKPTGSALPIAVPPPTVEHAAPQAEVERVARVLYDCEKRRSDIADAVISAAAGKNVSVGMEPWEECWQVFHGDAEAVLAALSPSSATEERWPLGTAVRKMKGSSWNGRVVGYYSTTLTPIGYAVESDREPGSVQIYPQSALERGEAR